MNGRVVCLKMASRQPTIFGFLKLNEPSENETKESKERYEKKRKRLFLPAWSNTFEGLTDTEDGMICTVCTEFKYLAGPTSFVSGNTSYRIDSIKSHFSSPKHLRCVEEQNAIRRRNAKEQYVGPMDVMIQKIGEEKRTLIKYIFNTAYCIMKQELPFNLYPALLTLQIKNGSDLAKLNSYQTDKACARFASYIAQDIRKNIKDAVDSANVLSIMFDGATDCSVTEVEIVYCRVVKCGVPTDYFLGLADVVHAHAQGVFEAIDQVMSEYGCPNWKDKLVAFGCDGASVNLGIHNSVATRLTENRPYVLGIHCVAHRLELGVLNALKDTPMLATIQDILHKVYKHYHYSPKALRELRSIGEAMDEYIIKPTRLSGTRWTPHLFRALQVLLSHYRVILAHFEHVSQAGPGQASAEVKGRATFIANKLRDWQVLRFMFFMEDILQVISTLSLKLQVNGLTCCDFLDGLETANLELIQLSSAPGIKLQTFLDNLEDEHENTCKFNTVLLKHYQTNKQYNDLKMVIDKVLERISGRFERRGDPTKQILQAAEIFDLKNWPSAREDLAVYGNTSLKLLIEHFMPLLHHLQCQVEQISHEWTHMKAHISNRLSGRMQSATISHIFQSFTLNDQHKNILLLIEVCLSIPMASATCERGFSCVKRIKSDWRSRLGTQMMNNLVLVAIEGPSLQDYEADGAMTLWWTQGQRQRRPQFEEEDDEDEDDLLKTMLMN